MLDLRAILGGLLAFLAVSALTVVTSTPPYLFVNGFIGGAVAGYLDGDGLRSGLYNGFLVGVGQFFLVVGAFAYIGATYRPTNTFEGHGFVLYFLLAFAPLYLVEGTIAAGLLGYRTG